MVLLSRFPLRVGARRKGILRHGVAVALLMMLAWPVQAQFEQIQLFPGTPDYPGALDGGGDIVEMPDGSLGVFYKVQTDYDTAGLDRLYLSTSSDGTTWSDPEEMDTSDHQGICCISAAADAVTGRVVVLYFNINTTSYRILYSDDGETWTNIAAPSTFQEATVHDLSAAPGGGFAAVMNTYPGGDSGPSYVTTSSDGLTWGARQEFGQAFDDGEICGSSIVQSSPTDLLVLFATCNFSHGTPWPILQTSSTDGGATWSDPVEALTSQLSFGRRMDMTRAADGTLWVVHTNREDLFYTSSTDGGSSWATSEQWTDNTLTPSSPGEDNNPVIAMYAGDPMVLFTARRPENEENHFYYGIPGVSDDPLATAIEQVSPELPQTIALEQNYPNPFNPSTTIRFSVSEAAPTRLVVYDLMGREVARLVDGALAPGTYEARFDGAALASGTYLYRLTSGSTSSQKLLTLLK